MTDVLEDDSVQPRRIQRYGWKPSIPDLRDHIADASELAVQDEVDPRGDLFPVFDQGQLGSCTANAVAAAVEYDAKLNGSDPGALSRLWIYYERKIEGSPADRDTGAYGRDGFKVCKTLGVPLEKDWPTTSQSSPNSHPPTWPRRRVSTRSPTTARCRGTSTR
jgi:C1A family cysteine protease